jgi:hypothetical protein
MTLLLIFYVIKYVVFAHTRFLVPQIWIFAYYIIKQVTDIETVSMNTCSAMNITQGREVENFRCSNILNPALPIRGKLRIDDKAHFRRRMKNCR